jgi:hypothetical protein
VSILRAVSQFNRDCLFALLLGLFDIYFANLDHGRSLDTLLKTVFFQNEVIGSVPDLTLLHLQADGVHGVATQEMNLVSSLLEISHIKSVVACLFVSMLLEVNLIEPVINR